MAWIQSIDSSTAPGVTDTPLYPAVMKHQRSLEDRPAASDPDVKSGWGEVSMWERWVKVDNMLDKKKLEVMCGKETTLKDD